MKVGADFARPRATELSDYAEHCAWVLARAHARTGSAYAIAAYLGRSDAFDRAIVRFAAAYADQNERDYDRFRRETPVAARGS